MFTGSCLCGSIRYELRQDLHDVVFCHCVNCQKATGSAFAAVAVVDVAHFTLTAGSAQPQAYASSPGVLRHFCGGCGSPLYSARQQDPDHYRLRLGTLDQPFQPRTKQHIFVAEQAAWHQIAADEPQYDARP